MNYDVKLSITDKKYYGNPPAIKKDILSSDDPELGKYYTWHAKFFNVGLWKEWVVSYMETAYSDNYVSYYKSSPNYMTTNTMGVNAKLLMSGHSLPNDVLSRFNNDILRCITYSANRKASKKVDDIEKPKPLFNQLIADIEDELDKLYSSNYTYTFSLYEFLTKRSISKVAAQEIITYYTPVLVDVKAHPEDFSGTKKAFKVYVAFLSSLIEDAEKYVSNKTVAAKKPSKKKVSKPKLKTNSELIKKLSYKKENVDLQLVSISPERIIGARMLVTYNDKYKIITLMIAPSDKTLSVRGTTVVNLDETQSLAKKIKKSDDLPSILVGNDKTVNRKINELPSKKQDASGRINSDTILLKVFT